VQNVTETRSERVDLRLTRRAKQTLQQAAAASNKTLSEFLIDSSMAAAFDALADRREFRLNAKQWAAFMKALNAPPKDNPGLRRLLALKPP
jgi:uncharacterized protein (DUF1778 family)